MREDKGTSASSPILLTDRTSIETDWDCGMKRWWYKEHGEKGIVPSSEAPYFKEGRDLHEDLARLNSGEALSEVVSKILGEAEEGEGEGLLETPESGYIDVDISVLQGGGCSKLPRTLLHHGTPFLETLYRRLGWVIAYSKFILPRLRDEYDVLAVERELVFQRGPLWVGVIPDLLLRSKKDPSRIEYVEYKTARSISDKWVNYWPYAIQLHLGILAASEDLQEEVSYARILGLVKGSTSYGRLHHPFVYGYVDKQGHWERKYRAGWTATGLWEAPFSLEEWVERLGEEVAKEQFIWSTPVRADRRLVDELVERRIERERQVAEVRDAAQTDRLLRAKFFEQRFTRCRPSYGDACPYLAACHNASVNLDPIGSGLYVPRTPHHELEIILSEEGE